jgi:dTDP-glucose 4,6-dehydratase
VTAGSRDLSGRTVAVTGAAGFVGSHLCEALVAGGARVIAVDNFAVGTLGNLEAIAGRLKLVRADISTEECRDILRGADVVFHLAAIANPRVCVTDFPTAYRVNVEGTRRVLEACAVGVRVVFLSGAMVYGDPIRLPMDEMHPTLGRDPYALTKIIGESLCWAALATRDIRPTVVRNFSTYGPRQSGGYLIPTLIEQGMRNRRIEIWNAAPTRDFTYVDDMVDALVRIGAADQLAGEVVNLGGGSEIEVGRVADAVARLLGGVPVSSLNKAVVGSIRQYCDNRKLRDATEWEPRVPLAAGLARTIDWFRQASPVGSPRGE